MLNVNTIIAANIIPQLHSPHEIQPSMREDDYYSIESLSVFLNNNDLFVYT